MSDTFHRHTGLKFYKCYSKKGEAYYLAILSIDKFTYSPVVEERMSMEPGGVTLARKTEVL